VMPPQRRTIACEHVHLTRRGVAHRVGSRCVNRAAGPMVRGRNGRKDAESASR
jgi:hypothetical protein